MFGKVISFFAENKPLPPPPFTLTGGVETTVGADKVVTFASSGTLNVSGSGIVKVLVVAGGMNGGVGDAIEPGFSTGAGGRGGEVVYDASFAITSGSYTITVGGSGQNSSFSTITANANTGALGGAAKTIDGNGSAGSAGTTSTITGSSYVYASGGGSGAYWGSYNGGAPGTGGGTGGNTSFTVPQDGSNGTNYGSGGGGAAFGFTSTYAVSNPGSGAGGVIIFRYTPN